ncbi:hypothetical protein [Maioricimonas rarisocia]|nr:hypothetical protein [Maioricimonas rarisocia]
MRDLESRRNELRNCSDCEFVEPEEFLQRAVSREPLMRADDPTASLLGLIELATGRRFVIEAEKMASFSAMIG